MAECLLELCDRFKDEYVYSSEKFVEIDPKGKILVIGDIHADFRSLKLIYSSEKDKLRLDKNDKIIHLGDYADRGNEPHLVYTTILSMALKYGENFLLLKGNHDHTIGVDLTPVVHPFDLDVKLQAVFGVDKGMEVCREIMRKVWPNLPYSAIVEGKYWFVHGGVPVRGRYEGTDVKRSEIENPSDDILWEMLWNDPIESRENGLNMRGENIYTFGWLATRNILDELGVRVIIRSHEPYKVLKVEQNGMVLTIGSCPNAYRMTKGSYLMIDLERDVKNANELINFARVFEI